MPDGDHLNDEMIVSCLCLEIYKLLTDILLATYHHGFIKITCTAFIVNFLYKCKAIFEKSINT